MPLFLAERVIHTPVSHPWLWGGFVLFLLVALAVDLLAHRRSGHQVSTRTALAWSVVWISLALGFAGVLLFTSGQQTAADFLTGYLTEESLSVDNLFVFVLVFSYFRIPPQHQHRVLMWGILGAMIMRAGMILLGAELVRRFHYTLAVFGVFLLYTGIKLLVHDDEEASPEKSRILRFLRRILPMAREQEHSSGSHDPSVSGRTRLRKATAFFVKEDGRWKVTNYFLVLLVIEFSDVVFAVDSVPAIFGAISKPPDPFIVFSSNMFAILGLRTLYFVIAAAIQHLRYLKYGLSLVLSFIGVKMLLPFLYEAWKWRGGRDLHPPAFLFDHEMDLHSQVSLMVVAGILIVTAGLSLLGRSDPSASSSGEVPGLKPADGAAGAGTDSATITGETPGQEQQP